MLINIGIEIISHKRPQSRRAVLFVVLVIDDDRRQRLMIVGTTTTHQRRNRFAKSTRGHRLLAGCLRTWHKYVVSHHKAQRFSTGRDTVARIKVVRRLWLIILVVVVVILLLLLLLVGVAAVHRLVSAGAVCLLTPSIGHSPWSVGAFLDQRLVILSAGTRVNGAPALVAIVLFIFNCI